MTPPVPVGHIRRHHAIPPIHERSLVHQSEAELYLGTLGMTSPVKPSVDSL